LAISKEEFTKALKSLEEALQAPKNDLNRDGTIQRFEFCVELAWKTCKKVMGSNLSAPKDIVREMARNSYITDVDFWLQAIDKRNLSSHTYNESLAEEVYLFAQAFLPYAKRLEAVLDSK
jgi:nucleotidyltransferase substrate binding protein (TIGR01987 family)